MEVSCDKKNLPAQTHVFLLVLRDRRFWSRIIFGPGAGEDGGRVVFEGTPADLVAGRSTLTGQHLAGYVAPG